MGLHCLKRPLLKTSRPGEEASCPGAGILVNFSGFTPAMPLSFREIGSGGQGDMPTSGICSP